MQARALVLLRGAPGRRLLSGEELGAGVAARVGLGGVRQAAGQRPLIPPPDSLRGRASLPRARPRGRHALDAGAAQPHP